MKLGIWYYIRKYGMKSIFVKCVLIIFMIIIVPLTILYSTIHYYYKDFARKDISNAYLHSLEKTRDSLDMRIEELQNISVVLASNNDLLYFGVYAQINKIDFDTLQGVVQTSNIISNLLVYQEMIDSIYIYYENSGVVCSNNYGNRKLQDFDDLEWLEYYNSLSVDFTTHIKYRRNEKNQMEYVTLMRRNGYGNNCFGTILNVRLDKLEELLMANDNEQEQLYLVDETDRILYSRNKSEIGIQFETAKDDELPQKRSDYVFKDNVKMIVNSIEMETIPWRLVSYISAISVEQQLSILDRWLLFGIVVSVMVGIAVAVIISRWLYNAMRILPDVLRGELGTENEYAKKADIGEINELMDNSSSSDAGIVTELQKAQLAALQSQINPHFMYNTLDAISWRTIGYLGEDNDVVDMIEKLADMMRLSMSQKSVMTTLEDELKSAEIYVKIMQFRFKNKIEYEDIIEHQYYDNLVPPFTLQPLIENAIIHGREGREEMLHIKVSCEVVRQTFYIYVVDDGVGIDEENLEKLMLRLQEGGEKSIALYNVNRRMQILFGKDYGMKIMTEKGKGTRIVLRIPKLNNK